jgi:hypothetical protein
MSHIKINRAVARAAVGRFPGSVDAMLERIPHAVAEALTSTQLALLLDAMWDACQEAKGQRDIENISNGCIWDASRQAMRDIARA